MVLETTKFYHWPADSRGQIVLNEKDYRRAIEVMLRLDFGSQELTAASTKRWIDEVGILAGLNHGWGCSIVGKKAPTEIPSASDVKNVAASNILQLKRKATESGENNNGAPNTLSTGLVRKKPKTEEFSETNGVPPRPGVNMLGGSLVKKKPKAP